MSGSHCSGRLQMQNANDAKAKCPLILLKFAAGMQPTSAQCRAILCGKPSIAEGQS